MPRVANRPAFLTDHVLDGLNQIAIENFVYAAAQSALARDAENLFERAVPCRDPALEVNYENADVDAFDDVLGELLEPGEFFRLLPLGPVQQAILYCDRDVAR